jgi:uncharacterized membrane protein YuzA (DUF378 family)
MSSSDVTMSPFGWIAGILSIIGALNWGFIGLFNFNLVRSIFGPMSWMFIYTIVGISGLYLLFSFLMRSERGGYTGRFGWSSWWR